MKYDVLITEYLSRTLAVTADISTEVMKEVKL